MTTRDDIERLYQEVILDHAKNPRQSETLEAPSTSAEGVNPVCGDHARVEIRVNARDDLEGVSVRVKGCSICAASGSIMAEEVEGLAVHEIETLIDRVRSMMRGGDAVAGKIGDLSALSGVQKFPVRVKCAVLPWAVLGQAIRQLRGEAVQKISTE